MAMLNNQRVYIYISFMSPIKNTCCSMPMNCWQLLPAAWQGTISLAAASLTFLATCRTLQWNRETPLCYPYSLSFITYLHLYLSYLIHISSIYHRSFMTYLVSGAPNKFVAKVSLGAAMASARPVGPDVVLGCSVWAKAESSAVRAKYDESMTWILYG